MSNEAFDGKALAEKLSKLNNSQQSIQSLSQWCILHLKKARQIVETWEKYFNSSQRERRISFLYLANDILQNSRRTGSEFVNEFWKVLPAALKHVYESDERGKKAATRLVDIWEERKVFGSRGRSLKDEMLGKDPPPLTVTSVKSSNPIKIVKRDAHSVRIKLAVGGLPEKIITAFQSVLDEHQKEEVALNKCSIVLQHVGKLEEDIESALIQGNQQGSAFVDELQEQENLLNECVGQLESAEATRVSLASQLKEALQDQELQLESIRSQLQVAQRQIEQASNIRKRLTSSPSNSTNPAAEIGKVVEQNQALVQPNNSQSQHLNQPVISFAPLKSTDEENKKAAAAAVAARLAASTSSAQMLTSVLSSLVAEEAASMNGGLTSAGLSSGLTMFPPEKRPKLEKPMPVSDVSSSDGGNAAYFTLPHAISGNQIPSSFAPPPPPMPLQSPVTPTSNQYVQSTGLMPGVMPFGYGSNILPPPPPLPSHFAMGLARPNPPPQQPQAQPQPQPQHSPQQQQQQQQQQQPQLQPANGGYYRPPGIGFYGQSHQPATPPVHRQ